MKNRCGVLLLAAGLGLVRVVSAQPPAAQSLEQLLDMVKQGQLVDAQAAAERKTRFGEERDRQQSALAAIVTERERAQARAVELEGVFEANQRRIDTRQNQLHQRMGSLRELFGHVARAGDELHKTLARSLTASQLGAARVGEIDRLTARARSGDSLPGIEELEMLWFEWQREIVEAGRVVKYQADVVMPDGARQAMRVVRIGNFGVIAESGEYLEPSGDTGSLIMLARQPAASLPAEAEDLAKASEGNYPFHVDPSGGTLLKAVAATPGFWERLHQGGVIGYLILVFGCIAIGLALQRLWVLHHLEIELDAQRHRDRVTTDNALGRLLALCETAAGMHTEALDLRLRAALLKERPPFERGLAELKLAGILALLLGLYSTATTAFHCLHDLAVATAVDYRMMADGLSAALVTAIEGLGVALPLWLLYGALSWRGRRILRRLEQDIVQALMGYGESADAHSH